MRTNLGVCLLFGLAAAASTSYALDNGECGTPQQITEKLKAEGQRSFAAAERVERVNGSNVLNGIVMTMNATGNVGFILESDKPTGEPASRICVRNRLTDIRLFDARKPGLPQEALLKATDQEALQKCAKLIEAKTLNAGTCAPYNRAMKKLEAIGERIAMQGFNVERQADGSYRKTGTMTTFASNMTGSVYDDGEKPFRGVIAGIFFTSLPDGATITNLDLIYGDFTPYGMSRVTK